MSRHQQRLCLAAEFYFAILHRRKDRFLTSKVLFIDIRHFGESGNLCNIAREKKGFGRKYIYEYAGHHI